MFDAIWSPNISRLDRPYLDSFRVFFLVKSVNLEIAAALLNWLDEYWEKIFPLTRCVSWKNFFFTSFYLLSDTASLRVLLIEAQAKLAA